MEGEGHVHVPHLHPGKRSSQESRKHWFAGTEFCSSGMGTQASWCKDKWLSTQRPHPPPRSWTPRPQELGKPCSPSASCLDLQPCPLLSPGGWGGGASRSPPHLPHCPRENHLHLQAASAPLPCLGKGSMPATSCQLGRGGGWSKDSAFILPNPQGGGQVGVGVGKEEGRGGERRAPAGFLWGGRGTGGCPLISRWRPWGKLLLPGGSQTGRFSRALPALTI